MDLPTNLNKVDHLFTILYPVTRKKTLPYRRLSVSSGQLIIRIEQHVFFLFDLSPFKKYIIMFLWLCSLDGVLPAMI